MTILQRPHAGRERQLSELATTTTSSYREKRAPAIDLSLVVPCYRETEHLLDSFPALIDYLDNLKITYEIIFVEDASGDGTPDMVRQLARNFDSIVSRVIYHESNQGRGKSVMDGIRHARGQVVGFIDIDLEVAPHYIAPCILPILKRQADVVIGKRIYLFSLFGIPRYLMSKVYRLLTKSILGIACNDTETGYKFFDRTKVLPLLDQCQDHHWFWDTEIMVRCDRAGMRLRETPCVFRRRRDKTSTVDGLSDSLTYFWRLLRFRWGAKRETREVIARKARA